ncbi:sugar transferase [Dermatophilus congolensis]|uniref:Putative colanic biosynthesis UDP-glucose lipid carrier transferase n=1 Tax=Dermatophilus congolensis TaxID=1863 RepID=A0A239VT33_9MICO|nr:sugar transferase [Dermatophilus congolensis]MBO3129934.1 sugar transferase [Dermatophilus congolensis]MBO3131436.1 sugar transferase [Dermatophilus congolensis]MBO3134408.1 sugar transferase [Dermatophilus congolensis]MBO3136644.1 sugar transferase [Dermatophilus congolensis]MBO3138888.1 sugar transferase [Dermatophilus congolensis]
MKRRPPHAAPPSRTNAWYPPVKRGIDIALAAVGLVTTAPLMAGIAIAVTRDSPGPVLFRQQRVGRNGHPFTIVKFRTMTVPASGETHLAVSATGDTRVTRTGAWLRATKLDELPQLLNVLRGEMSLVGPRPEVPEWVEHWPPERAAVILSVRPGITDPASIEFRNEGDLLATVADPADYYVHTLLPRKTARYVDYVRSASLMSDLRILLATVRAVLGRN